MKIDNNKNGICVFDFVSFRLTISCRWDSVEPVREEGFRNPPPVILPNPTGYCVLQGARKQGRKEEGFCNPVTGGFAEPDGGLRASRGKEAGKEEGFCNPITGGFAKPDGELRASRGKEAGKEEGFCNPITGGFAEPDGGLRASRGEEGRKEGGRVLQPDHRWFCRTRWRIACFKGRTKEGNKANNHGVSQSDGKKLCGGGNHAPATCHTKHPTCCAEYSAILGINHRWIDSPR